MVSIANFLRNKKAILLDGATGTNLFTMGLAIGQAPELWNISAPEKISRLHTLFLQAGSDAILTNSFGGNARRLALHKAEDQVYALNHAAAQIARESIENSDSQALVFGSVGPTGDLLFPLGELTEEKAEQCFADQAKALHEGGVDAFWIETLSSIEEAAAAIRGIQQVSDRPIALCMSFDTAGRTMMGLEPANLYAKIHEEELRVDSIGANCGLGPAELLETMIAMRASRPEIILAAKSNYGIPEFRDGAFHYHGTPELMARYAEYCLDIGVQIIGGCCGSTPETIACMRAAIDTHTPREMTPELEAEITDFIAENRSSPAQALASKAPTDPQGSDKQSARRSRSRRPR